jgi:hypothetical protein
MIIFYNRKSESWTQNGQVNTTFGGLKGILPVEPKASSDSLLHVPFQFQLKDQHVGPLIGIMTSPKNEFSLAGNRNLFISIQEELLSRDSLSFVFSYLDIKKDGTITGFIYSPQKQGWIRAVMPFPDIVYNRVPFRTSEKSFQYKNGIDTFSKHQIPVFNPGFIDKYELFQLLASNVKLQTYLPDTILVDSKATLKQFFNNHKDIYIKPCLQSKGKNIFRLFGDIRLKSNSQESSFLTFDDFWAEYQVLFSTDSFIAQRTIKPFLMQGIRYDFRILSHWSSTEECYTVTGVGIRAVESQQITTHLANGGFIVPYERVQSRKHDRFISALVKAVGLTLSKALGFFGEFSIDAGIDSDGNYVIYEVNSKPMSFDEREIEEMRISNLCHIFFHQSGFEV